MKGIVVTTDLEIRIEEFSDPLYKTVGSAGGGYIEHVNNDRTDRRPDCVTEIRMGNTVLVVSGFFKKDTTATAADKMMKVLEAETAATHKPSYTA